VDPTYRPKGLGEKSNPARQSRFRWLQTEIRRLHYFMVSIGLSGMIKWLKRIGMKEFVMMINSKPFKKEPMPKEVKAYIIEQVRDDVKQLEKLTGKDLSHWLKLD
jgi:benzoyl-CoA reductase/2-hydroxyglutaryl-CoA dehydratase subunit BcrC/BadD/HgdB